MTLLPTKRSRQFDPIKLVLGSAAGSSDDFFVLGYSSEYDELESARHPEHEQSTFILSFRAGVRSVQVVPRRLNDIWQSPQGHTYAVGEPRGVLAVSHDGVTEVSIDDVAGTFASVWGTDEAHIFACGNYRPFWLYRRAGIWHRLSLPADVGGLWRVAGVDNQDVYAVSDHGEILHFDGRQVHRLDSPTTRWLVAVATMPDRRVCIAGHQGIFLYGDINGWRTVDSGTDSPILNLVSFSGGVCFVTPGGLWHFDGKEAPRLLADQPGRWVSRVGDTLIIVNSRLSWLFDGTQLRPLDTTV